VESKTAAIMEFFAARGGQYIIVERASTRQRACRRVLHLTKSDFGPVYGCLGCDEFAHLTPPQQVLPRSILAAEKISYKEPALQQFRKRPACC
jgi:hypothetical protein